MIAAHYLPTHVYYSACIVVGVLVVLRLAWLVKRIGWRGIIRETVELIGG
jgi:hypothetical protein